MTTRAQVFKKLFTDEQDKKLSQIKLPPPAPDALKYMLARDLDWAIRSGQHFTENQLIAISALRDSLQQNQLAQGGSKNAN